MDARQQTNKQMSVATGNKIKKRYGLMRPGSLRAKKKGEEETNKQPNGI